MKRLAISIGDINGVGLEIALKAHDEIKAFCKPLYFINKPLLDRGAKLLDFKIPDDFSICECGSDFEIKPGKIIKKAGKFSFISFLNALNFVKKGKADALVTLPINKLAWAKAGIKYHGHTDALSDIFSKNAIMMLGCEDLFVGLYSDHEPLKAVPKMIKKQRLSKFLCDFAKSSGFENVGVLGLNPHAGDGGVIGKEDEIIAKAIKLSNKTLKKDIFFGPLVPDAAFIQNALKKCNKIVAMYHDQGLAPLKALYFENSINVSLNLPILRVSVDHGTAFDIAYKGLASTLSYKEAINYTIKNNK